jgi:hypothetical protein
LLFYFQIQDQRPKERNSSASPPQIQRNLITNKSPSQQQHQQQPVSTTLTNVLVPLFSHLNSKYRHTSSSNSSSSSASSSSSVSTVEHSIDELKSSFYYIEQQKPGACDLFIKCLFDYVDQYKK